MSWALLVLAIGLLAIMEKIWAPAALKRLNRKGGCDKVFAEPGEVITWNAAVENSGRLPIPFVRLRQHFPVEAQILGTESWRDSHCQKSLRQWHVEEKLSLKPRQRSIRTLRFTIPRRGVYPLGSCELAAGDLLGLTEQRKEEPGQRIVIIPERAQNRQALAALGGFLGDISVRRFILEDPVLTVGFRDYTGREPLKAVSWTRTAATGTMQVKQYDHTAEQTVMILLNVEGATLEELEGCFRLMRMVCEELERNKIPFGFRTNGNLPGPVGKLFWLADGLGSRHVHTILYALGQADDTCYHSFRYLAKQTLKHRKHNEAYIVITPWLTEETRNILKQLEGAVGNPVCVLTGRQEAERT